MVKISEKQSGTPLGTLDDLQFQFLADHLEEESRQDDDYYLNRTTVDFLATREPIPPSSTSCAGLSATATRRRSAGSGPEPSCVTALSVPSACSACWSFWGCRRPSPNRRPLPGRPASSG